MLSLQMEGRMQEAQLQAWMYHMYILLAQPGRTGE